jgi:hypothetical protein
VPDNHAKDKSLPTLAAELWALVQAYVKQETLEPVKGIGRYVAFGAAGSLLIGSGAILLLVALLRVLQNETGTTFEGNWTFAPYLITLVAAAVVIGLALAATRKRGSTS